MKYDQIWGLRILSWILKRILIFVGLVTGVLGAIVFLFLIPSGGIFIVWYLGLLGCILGIAINGFILLLGWLK